MCVCVCAYNLFGFIWENVQINDIPSDTPRKYSMTRWRFSSCFSNPSALVITVNYVIRIIDQDLKMHYSRNRFGRGTLLTLLLMMPVKSISQCALCAD